MESFFISHVTQWHAFIYPVIFLGMMVEGEAIMFTSFYLAQLGLLNIAFLIPITVVGTLVGDSMWFTLASFLERIPVVRHILFEIKDTMDSRLKKRLGLTLFISKFTYGLHHVTIIRARNINTPKNIFIKANTIASLAWISIIGCLAYFSSASISGTVKGAVRYTEFGLLACFLILVIINRVVSYRFKKKLAEEQKQD